MKDDPRRGVFSSSLIRAFSVAPRRLAPARCEGSGPRRGRGFGPAPGSDLRGHGHLLGHVLIRTDAVGPGVVPCAPRDSPRCVGDERPERSGRNAPRHGPGGRRGRAAAAALPRLPPGIHPFSLVRSVRWPESDFLAPLLGSRHAREIDRQANAPAGRRDLRPRPSQLPGSATTWQRCDKKVRDDPQRAATAVLRGISMAASDASEDGQAGTSGENGSAAASAAAYHHRKEVPHNNPKRQRDRPR